MSDSVQPETAAHQAPCPWDSPGKNIGVGCHFFLQCMKVKSESEVTQSCSTLSDSMDCSLPGSSLHGIFHPRVLEWGAIGSPLVPGKSHGRRSLEGCSPWGCWGLDTTERLHFHFSLSRFGEGNGNPLQCSCLENPRDGGAWWAAIYGVVRLWSRVSENNLQIFRFQSKINCHTKNQVHKLNEKDN